MRRRHGRALGRGALTAALAAVLFLAVPCRVRGQDAGGEGEWSSAGRLHAYVHDLVGPGAILGVVAATASDQLRNDPPEWGKDAQALGHRAATNAASLVVAQSTRHAVAIALGRSTRYQFCQCSGFGPQVGHAFVETFTDRDPAGKRMVSLPRFAGAAVGALSYRIWRPGETNRDTALRFGSSLLFSFGSNAVNELLHTRR